MGAAIRLALGAALAALATVPALAQSSQGRPPQMQSVDPLDPFTGGGELPQGAPAKQPAKQPVKPAAQDAAAGASAAPAERSPKPAIDFDSLKGRLLDQGSAPLEEVEPAPPVPGQRVVLRGLDKMTGALGEAEAKVGETAKLWRLEIDVKACFSRVEASKSAAGSAFVQIRDTKNDKSEMVFSGWMFAASPALSAMDHPRYDVWVLSCKIS